MSVRMKKHAPDGHDCPSYELRATHEWRSGRLFYTKSKRISPGFFGHLDSDYFTGISHKKFCRCLKSSVKFFWRGIMSDMKWRKLRIAWSVGCGVLAVLLCVLWVRSYWTWSYLSAGITTKQRLGFNSASGSLIAVVHFHHPATARPRSKWEASSVPAPKQPAYHRFMVRRLSGGFSIGIPFWFLIPLNIVAAAAPWLRWRFSLRTLLIVTTLVALLLGLFVWSAR